MKRLDATANICTEPLRSDTSIVGCAAVVSTLPADQAHPSSCAGHPDSNTLASVADGVLLITSTTGKNSKPGVRPESRPDATSERMPQFRQPQALKLDSSGCRQKLRDICSRLVALGTGWGEPPHCKGPTSLVLERQAYQPHKSTRNSRGKPI